MSDFLTIMWEIVCAVWVICGSCAIGWWLAHVWWERKIRPRRERDAKLANWARNTMVCVTSRTGYVYAVNLEDLANDERGSCRSWSEPAAVLLGYGPSDYAAQLSDLNMEPDCHD